MSEQRTISVLIPSYQRPAALRRCLESLARQTVPPQEIVVVWQGDDHATAAAAQELAAMFPVSIRVLHSVERGVVPAENLALDAARGEIVALIDDDAVAPPDWVERHVALYADPTVGAVGGPADNYFPDGSKFPVNHREPIGRLHWTGRLSGNMHTQAPEWRSRGVIEVDHLVGYNLSLRRIAFDRFEAALLRYWQMFELDACLQVRRRGFRVLFDYGNVVAHHPTNTAYVGGRDGDLQVRIFNSVYNAAFILSKHSPWWLRLPRLLYLTGVGTTATPGMLGAIVGCLRYGHPLRELRILLTNWQQVSRGWTAGARRRSFAQAQRLPAQGGPA